MALDSAKILTIDDEFVLRQSIVAYLEDSGFTVVEGENGRHGLEVFREEKPDLVLTDLQMPEMGGLDVLATINKESPDTPVIVVSGAGGMNDVIEALRLGAWDYLTKPVTDLAVLEHAVCKSLERSRLIEENRIYQEKLKKYLETLEEDQRAGRSVQTRLLPEQNVNYGEYNINHSMTPSLYLSGDFLDHFRVNDDKVCVYLADVSGHGAASAFVTVLLKNTVSQFLTRYQASGDESVLVPGDIMAKVSSIIHSAKLGKYLTMVYGILDEKTGEYDYCVGGHYPNPILVEDGKARYLEGDGFPVGIIGSVTYTPHKVTIPKGGRMFVFSDGVMEVMPQPDCDGKEAALLELVTQSEGDPDKVLELLGINVDEELPDDITFWVLQRN